MGSLPLTWHWPSNGEKPSQTLYNLTNPLQLFVLLCKPEGRCVLVFPSCCSYLVDRWTLTRAMERGPMISVTWDQSLDEAAFRPQDEDDPRSMGTWPCGLAHQPPIVSEGSNLPYPVEWLQNEHFRAASCPRCALVLGYWPRVGHGGSYFIRPHSDVVREALREVRRDNPNDTTAQIVRAKILEVQLRWGHQPPPPNVRGPTATSPTSFRLPDGRRALRATSAASAGSRPTASSAATQESPAVEAVYDPPHGDATQESPAVDAVYDPPHGDCEEF